MTVVTRKASFEAAHMLSGYDGRCRNLHGHSYGLEVSVAGPDGDDMVIDFRKLKETIEQRVLAVFDHAFIYNSNAPAECAVAETAGRLGLRTVALPFASTSENLAHHVFRLIAEEIPGLVSVRIRETADNCAEYRV